MIQLFDEKFDIQFVNITFVLLLLSYVKQCHPRVNSQSENFFSCYLFPIMTDNLMIIFQWLFNDH